ncbi:nucleoredoxin-like protein 2 [Limulus polyphemus]|uniref:Nucleoredoxin-like protein 2 n=1 Tax=Limulus polyphemus TaxID=6850 RepID=A0ABM1BF94_LIMPO|nr:nucleoredoxin-like protein 2 [Limulus polyphemus]
MEFIKGLKLIRRDKSEVEAKEFLEDKEVVGFFFGNRSCPWCLGFTSYLDDIYLKLQKQGASFEVILISSDDKEEAMFGYMDQMEIGWPAVPFNSDVRQKLIQLYDVQSIPALIIVKKDGSVVTKEGVEELQEKEDEAFSEWSR